jgi:integrase
VKLTNITARALELPPGMRDKIFFDDDVRGFGLRLRSTGSKTWVIQYDDVGGRARKVVIGPLALIDAVAARAKAKAELAAIQLGSDPAKEKRQARERAAETFGALLPRFLRQVQRRPRSLKELERALCKHAKPLHSQPIASIDRRAVAGLLSKLTEASGPAATKAVRAGLIKYFTWAMKEGLIESNPSAFTNVPVVNGARKRLLTDAEIREILLALEDDDYGCVVQLILFTASRKTEIGDLRWDDELYLDEAEIRLPAERTKNNRPHVVPLAETPLALLRARPRNGDRAYVFGRGGRRGFQGWAQCKSRLDQRIAAARKAAGISEPMPPWVLHDFRRCFSTAAHERLGIAPHIVEACLGHVSGFRMGVAGTYNLATYLAEKQRALTKWAVLLDEIVSGKRSAAKVLKLR